MTGENDQTDNTETQRLIAENAELRREIDELRDQASYGRTFKLIRDGLKGRPGDVVHTAESPTLQSVLLINKLYEEIGEIARDLTNAEEYADALEALETLAFLNSVRWSRIIAAKDKKHVERGGFSHGQWLIRWGDR